MKLFVEFSCNFPSLLYLMFPPASPVAQGIKHLPAMRETQVRSLGWEDPLEKEMAPHSSTLAWSGLPFPSPGDLPDSD